VGAGLYVLVLALHEEGPCIGLEAQLDGSAPLPGVRSASSQRVPVCRNARWRASLLLSGRSPIDPLRWLAHAPSSTSRIVRTAEDCAIWEQSGPEIGPESCRTKGCSWKRVPSTLEKLRDLRQRRATALLYGDRIEPEQACEALRMGSAEFRRLHRDALRTLRAVVGSRRRAVSLGRE
jgi:hypothetical protein